MTKVATTINARYGEICLRWSIPTRAFLALVCFKEPLWIVQFVFTYVALRVRLGFDVERDCLRGDIIDPACRHSLIRRSNQPLERMCYPHDRHPF